MDATRNKRNLARKITALFFYRDTLSVTRENPLYFVQRWANLLIGVNEPDFQSRYNNLWTDWVIDGVTDWVTAWITDWVTDGVTDLVADCVTDWVIDGALTELVKLLDDVMMEHIFIAHGGRLKQPFHFTNFFACITKRQLTGQF